MNITPLLGQLDINLNELESALEPLLEQALSETVNNLPLLERAKLYVLTTYAIESILFSLLRINGVNAKEHPVFRELTRVKQYFDKIKAVETSGVKRENMSLNKEAAGRVVKHALAAYDLDRQEKLPKGQARVRARADILARREADEVAASESNPAVASGSGSNTFPPST